MCPAFFAAVRNDFPCVKEFRDISDLLPALAQSAVRCNTAANYESQWILFSAFCAEEHNPRIAPPPDLLSAEVIQAVWSLVGMEPSGRKIGRTGVGSVLGVVGDDAQDFFNCEVCTKCAKDDGAALWHAIRKWWCTGVGAAAEVSSRDSSSPERGDTATGCGGPATGGAARPGHSPWVGGSPAWRIYVVRSRIPTCVGTL